jgi:transcriptional regulator CtsR
MIPHALQNVNSYAAHRVQNLNSGDLLSTLLNQKIADGIESYIRSFSKLEIEVIKYLNYYFKKWGGNIEIPIKNLTERFQCSARWIHVILKRLYNSGWIIKTGGGYGRKVTKRTFSERGKMITKALTEGFGIVKKLIHSSTSDYCSDYSPSTNYISPKVNNILKEDVSVNKIEEKKKEDFEPRSALDIFQSMRKTLRI